jgi:hypothetical protein
MIKIFAMLLVILGFSLSTKTNCAFAESIFYVSPNGNDLDNGSMASPWKSLHKASATLKAGQTAVFLNGTYVENKPIYFTNSGSSNQRIILRAQNPQQATIYFSDTYENQRYKFVVNRSFITVKDFVITQTSKHPNYMQTNKFLASNQDGSLYENTEDILLASRPLLANDPDWIYENEFIGNRLFKAYEECLKSYKTSGLLMKGNSCQDTEHEGIDLVNVENADIDSNEIIAVGRIGILAKGGSRGIQIRNNYIHSLGKSMKLGGGIFLGGSTGYSSLYLPLDHSQPYEIYGSAAWNNVIFAQFTTSGEGKIPWGLILQGSINSGFFNNTVVNAEIGLAALQGGHPNWLPNFPRPNVTNGEFVNNIIYNARGSAVEFPTSLDLPIKQFNLFYASVKSPKNPLETLLGNPNFDTTTTPYFHLKSGSIAIGTGKKIEFTGFSGKKYDLGLDKIGHNRNGSWSMGAFQD